MNIAESVLILMLLWLIGGSPPVRSRHLSSLLSYNNNIKPSDNSSHSLKYDTTTSPLSFQTNDRSSWYNQSRALRSLSPKEYQNNSFGSCNERRTLLQMVIDSPTIYEVTVVSKSVADKGGEYAVTFRVRKVFKQENQKQRIKHIRLFFKLPNNNLQLNKEDTFSSLNAKNCFSRAAIKHNKRYILFLGQNSESDDYVSSQKLHLVSGPVQKSKAFVRSMKKYLCRNCGIKIRSLSNTDLIEGDTIKMKCTVKLKSSHQLHLFENDNIQRRNQKSLWDDYRFKYKLERQRGDQNMFPHSSPLLSHYQHSRSFVKRSESPSSSTYLSRNDGNADDSLRVRVLWYRNGKRIFNSRKIKVKQKRLSKQNSIRSILRVRNANTTDDGVFECRLRPKLESRRHRVKKTAEVRKRFAGANTSMQKQSMRKNKAFLKYMLLMNQVESRKVSIRVTPFTPYSTVHHRRINPIDMKEIMLARDCPIDSYCLNGGTCAFYSSIGEMSCSCDIGFIGKRCERKDAYSSNFIPYRKENLAAKRNYASFRRRASTQSKSPRHSSRCILGLTHYPC